MKYPALFVLVLAASAQAWAQEAPGYDCRRPLHREPSASLDHVAMRKLKALRGVVRNGYALFTADAAFRKTEVRKNRSVSMEMSFGSKRSLVGTAYLRHEFSAPLDLSRAAGIELAMTVAKGPKTFLAMISIGDGKAGEKPGSRKYGKLWTAIVPIKGYALPKGTYSVRVPWSAFRLNPSRPISAERSKRSAPDLGKIVLYELAFAGDPGDASVTANSVLCY